MVNLKSFSAILLFALFVGAPQTATCQNIDKDLFSPKWNFGIGAGSSGYYSIFPDDENQYFSRFSFRANAGYFIGKQTEIGLIAQFRSQRTNIAGEENAAGSGGGYYLRYNITQFDPLKAIFKDKFKSKSFFFVEWEHQLTNYDFINDFPNREILNMTNTGEFDNHLFLPKIGWKMLLKNNFFINAQIFYRVANGQAVNYPLGAQLSLEYTF